MVKEIFTDTVSIKREKENYRERVELLDPKNDAIFKMLFGDENNVVSSELLIYMLNLILDEDDVPIRKVEYKNPMPVIEMVSQKEITLDVKVTTDKNQVIDVEMQMTVNRIYKDRAGYYGNKMVSTALKRGEDYGKMPKVIHISIVNGTVYREIDGYHVHFRTVEKNHPEIIMSEKMPQFHFLELGKLSADIDIPRMTELERFLYFLKVAGGENDYEIIDELCKYDEGGMIVVALAALSKISEDERMQEIAEMREKFAFDQFMLKKDKEVAERNLREAEEKVREVERKLQEAEEKARETERNLQDAERKREREEIIFRMIDNNMDNEIIAKVVNVPVAEVERLRNSGV